MQDPKRKGRPATESEMNGDLPMENAILAKDNTYRNPGPTPNLRGVETNTSRNKGTQLSKDDLGFVGFGPSTAAPTENPPEFK
jgi:hypothetical protein